MVSCELVDASPLEIRVIPFVGDRMAIVSGDDSQIVEPAKVLPSGLGVTVGAVGDRARRRRLACLQDGAVDALFDIVAGERIREGGLPSGGVFRGHTRDCRPRDIVHTSGNTFPTSVAYWVPAVSF